MGKKVNPISFRLSQHANWSGRWFERKTDAYIRKLKQDTQLNTYLYKRLKEAGIERIEIERLANATTVIIYVAKPGVVIGRGGKGVEDLKKEIQDKFFNTESFRLSVQEVAHPQQSARLTAQGIVDDLEKRMPFRRSMKRAAEQVTKGGGLGVKIVVSGRLNGAEIARTEKLAIGKVPLHTLRSNIDYANLEARTIFGTIGVKVWVYKGEVFTPRARREATAA